MPAMPPISDPTLAAVDAALVQQADAETPRGYLGVSSIGSECERALWYSFRWCGKPNHSASTLRKFRCGQMGETLMAERLRMVKGVELWTEDAHGQQFGCSDHGGHLRGHVDGVIKGILQAPKTAHVWEHKQCSEKVFADFKRAIEKHGEKGALQAWNNVYFVQAQLYMHYFDLTRHYLTVSTPGGRDYASARTEYDREVAEHYIKRARRIIESSEPPLRIANDPASSACKPYGRLCEFHSICHGQRVPQPSCRTCAHSTPRVDAVGGWHCERHSKALDVAAQRAGCDKHLTIPPLIPYAELEQGQDGEDFLDYHMRGAPERRFRQGQSGFSSAELAALDKPDAIFDQFVQTLRTEMGGQIVPDVSGMHPSMAAVVLMESDIPFMRLTHEYIY